MTKGKRLLKTLSKIERVKKELYAMQDAERGRYCALTAEEQNIFGNALYNELVEIGKVLDYICASEEKIREIISTKEVTA